MAVRTRMAPSPTGEFHIGGMRTLLYNFALAKKNDGAFVLRIEDTDRQRFVPGSLERLLQVIKDYGLSWDEGPEIGGPYIPYIQSERLYLYREYASKLVEKEHAYYCFCSEERLTKIREEQQKAGLPVTKYDKLCRGLSKEDIDKKIENGEKYILRFRMPEDEDISFEDLFLGTISFNSKDLDDYILLKSDGFPTYHLAVVIDDHLMEISHVLRGVEWLSSTPKHILLYKAFGWKMPLHGHLPNLKEVGANKKLSKRSGTVDAVSFLTEGYLPEALLNFLMFLGWNPGTEKELYSLSEFIQDFSLDRVHKTDLVAFDREKLLWFNGVYIRKLSMEELYERITKWAQKFKVELLFSTFPKEYSLKCLGLVSERLKKFNEINDLTSYFFTKPSIDSKLLVNYAGSLATVKNILKNFHDSFLNVDTTKWSKDNLDSLSHELILALGLKPKEAFMTLRIALTGKEATPPLFDVVEVLGKDEVLNRLKELF